MIDEIADSTAAKFGAESQTELEIKMSYDSLPGRLLMNTVFDDGLGCWIWTGEFIDDGPRTTLLGKRFDARALIYVVFKGALRPSARLASVCGNARCVNPAHTRSKNEITEANDGVITRRRFLSDDEVLAIRASDEPNKVLALRYGVHVNYISDVRNFKRRKSVRVVQVQEDARYAQMKRQAALLATSIKQLEQLGIVKK
jgi:hypothetical protein